MGYTFHKQFEVPNKMKLGIIVTFNFFLSSGTDALTDTNCLDENTAILLHFEYIM